MAPVAQCSRKEIKVFTPNTGTRLRPSRRSVSSCGFENNAWFRTCVKRLNEKVSTGWVGYLAATRSKSPLRNRSGSDASCVLEGSSNRLSTGTLANTQAYEPSKAWKYISIVHGPPSLGFLRVTGFSMEDHQVLNICFRSKPAERPGRLSIAFTGALAVLAISGAGGRLCAQDGRQKKVSHFWVRAAVKKTSGQPPLPKGFERQIENVFKSSAEFCRAHSWVRVSKFSRS